MTTLSKTFRSTIAGVLMVAGFAAASTGTAFAEEFGSYGSEIEVQIDHNHQPMDPYAEQNEEYVNINNSHQPLDPYAEQNEEYVNINNSHQPLGPYADRGEEYVNINNSH
jgi:3-keto-L-gulonate-6-phosphate decarboxylase